MDKQKVKKRNQSQMILFLSFLGLLTLVILFFYIYNMRMVTDKLIDDSIDMQVSQNVQYISNSLEHGLTTLENIAEAVVVHMPDMKIEDINNYINYYVLNGEFKYINFFDIYGTSYRFDGTTEDVKGRDGYEKAIKGENNITDSIYDTVAGINMVLYSVPIYKDGIIVGGLVGCRNTDEVKISLIENFGVDDYIGIVVNQEGDIVLSSNQEGIMPEKNIFESFAAKKEYVSSKEYEKIRFDMLEGKSDIIHMNSVKNGYIAYRNIEINDSWYYLCYVIPNNYSSYTSSVFMLTIGAVALVLLVLTSMTTYIFRLEKMKKEEIEETELTDKLTQISNEAGFQIKVLEQLRKDYDDEYVLVVLDVDNFKFINHSFSYRLGDEILIQIADSITDYVKEDGVTARISSDTFAVFAIIEDNITDKIQQIINIDIRNKFGKAIEEIVHINMGYYNITNHQEKVRFMMDKASYAWKYARQHKMIAAKKYDDEIMEYQVKLKKIESTQQHALEKEEFKVYLQPKVDLEKNVVTGAEALVRWISEDYGFMPPDDFIPIFENNGFVREVDFFVLETVCKTLQVMLDEGETPITISINQSRITIMDEYYLDRLKGVMDQYNIPTQYIDLEVTEGLFIGDYNSIIQILKKVKSLGFSISMDDFGSGYSSLNLLKEMPIDNLKIDKVFLDESKTSNQSRIIIKSVIEMARNLQMSVVCEGVETESQVRFLQEIKCDVAQGYYYDKPIPMEDFYVKMKDGSYSVWNK